MKFLTFFIQIANPTVLEPAGVTFLRPVWDLITGYYLLLNEDDIAINYKKYINNFKRALAQNEVSIEQAVNDGLTPGSNSKIKLISKIII